MKLGILTNLGKEEEVSKTKEIANKVLEDLGLGDIIVFYTGDNTGESFNAPTMDTFNLWSFNGKLIFFSMSDVQNFLNIPCNIQYTYYADLDTKYEPLKLLMNKDNISVITCSKDKHKTLARTLGSNIEIKVYDNTEDILEDIQ